MYKMYKRIVFLSLTAAALFLFSCEEGDNIFIPGDTLTEQEVAAGLRQALTVGTDTAVKIVSVVDGFYLDPVIKILLPPEADVIVNHADDPLLVALGIDQLIEDVVLRMNRAAEDAAKSATPIFVNAITSMTIVDAFDILNGHDTAATHYLRTKTYTPLKEAFQPIISESLDKPLVAGASASDAWSTLTTAYNEVAQWVGWNTVNTELDEHVTKKGLDGLFVKVAEEEKDIRTDPLARVTDLLKKVFGGG